MQVYDTARNPGRKPMGLAPQWHRSERHKMTSPAFTGTRLGVYPKDLNSSTSASDVPCANRANTENTHRRPFDLVEPSNFVYIVTPYERLVDQNVPLTCSFLDYRRGVVWREGEDGHILWASMLVDER
eukprot:scaffold1225_cov164-Amphora_coffeaeformis.AAC.30